MPPEANSATIPGKIHARLLFNTARNDRDFGLHTASLRVDAPLAPHRQHRCPTVVMPDPASSGDGRVRPQTPPSPSAGPSRRLPKASEISDATQATPVCPCGPTSRPLVGRSGDSHNQTNGSPPHLNPTQPHPNQPAQQAAEQAAVLTVPVEGPSGQATTRSHLANPEPDRDTDLRPNQESGSL